MIQFIKHFIFAFSLFIATNASAQSDSIVLKDIKWETANPAGSTELFIPSAGSKLAGMIYRSNGSQKHPTLILLHGFPGNERNLDLAQVARAKGWNVIYFNYRGAWGSQGKFSFKNCVEDVTNVVAFCNKYQDSLKIDTANIVLFGHSMGGWVCLKALEQLPQVKKVYYPEIDGKQLTGYGTLLFFDLRNDLVKYYHDFKMALKLFLATPATR